MSKNDKPEIEELLNSYIDGELSDRQQTELKRLIQHDPEIARRFKSLRRQKEFLEALPVERAPQGLADEVMANLERKLLLDEGGVHSDRSRHSGQMLIRRILSSAAMLLIPLGLLGWVVFSVIMPAEDTSVPVIVKQPVQPEVIDISDEPIIENTTPEYDVQYAFNGRLDIRTADTIAVNSFIEKAIYNNGLIDSTIPKRQAANSSYTLSCDQGQLAGLLDDLHRGWAKFESACLIIYDAGDEVAVMVDRVTAQQIQAVFDSSDLDSRIATAKNFADINVESAFGDTEEDSELSIPIKPVLASPQKPKTDQDDKLDGDKINLIITVNTL